MIHSSSFGYRDHLFEIVWSRMIPSLLSPLHWPFQAQKACLFQRRDKKGLLYFRKKPREMSISDKNYERKGGSEEGCFKIYWNMRLLISMGKLPNIHSHSLINWLSQQILSTCSVLESALTLGDTVVNPPSKEELGDF